LSNTGKMSLKVEQDVSNRFNVPKGTFLRCSTSWKSFDQGTYLCGLHTKKKGNSFAPIIRSILVEIDGTTLLPLRKTPDICVDVDHHNRVQFLSGLEITSEDVILTLGISDYKVQIYKLPRTNLKDMLKE
jgi:hypothetical protein